MCLPFIFSMQYFEDLKLSPDSGLDSANNSEDKEEEHKQSNDSGAAGTS